MSDYASLFLNKFNPCPDRVDSIEKYLLSELDEGLLPELMDHIEKCKRCRRYHGFMESVEKGLHDYDINTPEISALAISELPSSLKTEMIMAMKRNLSKWMYEMARSIMYREGIIGKFFIHVQRRIPLNTSLLNSENIIRSLKRMIHIPLEDKQILSEANYILSDLKSPLGISDKKNIENALRTCINLDRDHLYPYFYYDEYYNSLGNYDSAIKISKEALTRHPKPLWKSPLINNIGRNEFRLGRFEEALSIFKEALECMEFPLPHINIALACMKNNKPDDAFAHYQRALVLTDKLLSPALRATFIRFCSEHFFYHFANYHKIITTHDGLKNLILKFQPSVSGGPIIIRKYKCNRNDEAAP